MVWGVGGGGGGLGCFEGEIKQSGSSNWPNLVYVVWGCR